MSKGKAEKPAISKDDWETPPAFFKYIADTYTFDGFDMDVAAQANNTKCSLFSDDSLEIEWSHRNWCNPPFSLKERFIEKAIKESLTGKITFMLLPASTGAAWFQKAIKSASSILFIGGRLTFVGAVNKKTGKPQAADFDVCVMVFEGLKLSFPHIEFLPLEPEHRR